MDPFIVEPAHFDRDRARDGICLRIVAFDVRIIVVLRIDCFCDDLLSRFRGQDGIRLCPFPSVFQRDILQPGLRGGIHVWRWNIVYDLAQDLEGLDRFQRVVVVRFRHIRFDVIRSGIDGRIVCERALGICGICKTDCSDFRDGVWFRGLAIVNIIVLHQAQEPAVVGFADRKGCLRFQSGIVGCAGDDGLHDIGAGFGRLFDRGAERCVGIILVPDRFAAIICLCLGRGWLLAISPVFYGQGLGPFIAGGAKLHCDRAGDGAGIGIVA